MKKILIVLIVVISFTACKDNSNPEEIKTKINEYKSEIVDLNNKITELERTLASQGDTIKKGQILVSTQKIKPLSFTHYIDLSGNVEADKEAFISTEINGLIKQIHVKEGSYVSQGSLLATLDKEMTLKTIDEVKTQLELANIIYAKQDKLWKENIGSELQHLQAKSNKQSLEKKLETLNTQLEMAEVRAPFSGYIESVYQKEGEIASPGRQIFHLINLNTLNVTANMSESYIPYIKAGDTSKITFSTFPDITIKKPIKVVGSVVNPNNRTIKIQIPISNPNNILKPNIVAQIKLVDQHIDSTIVIPSIVVKNDAKGRNYVYVVSDEEGKKIARKRFVETAKSYGNKTMISNGLNICDQLIIQGYNLVKNGSHINVK